MKLQYISDIHDKFPLINPVANYIALLGDIGDPFTIEYQNFIEDLSLKFKKVFVIAGNHEYYFNIFDDVNSKMKEIETKYNNVHFLNNESIEVEGYLIVGSTLWSNITHTTSYRINDFRYIRKNELSLLDMTTYLTFFNKAVEFIKQETNKNIPMIVLTHHGPIYEMNGEYKGTALCSAFTSDLSDITTNIKCWLSGHTHQCLTIEQNGVIYSSNCMGYRMEGVEGFDINKYIEI